MSYRKLFYQSVLYDSLKYFDIITLKNLIMWVGGCVCVCGLS